MDEKDGESGSLPKRRFFPSASSHAETVQRTTGNKLDEVLSGQASSDIGRMSSDVYGVAKRKMFSDAGGGKLTSQKSSDPDEDLRQLLPSETGGLFTGEVSLDTGRKLTNPKSPELLKKQTGAQFSPRGRNLSEEIRLRIEDESSAPAARNKVAQISSSESSLSLKPYLLRHQLPSGINIPGQPKIKSVQYPSEQRKAALHVQNQQSDIKDTQTDVQHHATAEMLLRTEKNESFRPRTEIPDAEAGAKNRSAESTAKISVFETTRVNERTGRQDEASTEDFPFREKSGNAMLTMSSSHGKDAQKAKLVSSTLQDCGSSIGYLSTPRPVPTLTDVEARGISRSTDYSRASAVRTVELKSKTQNDEREATQSRLTSSRTVYSQRCEESLQHQEEEKQRHDLYGGPTRSQSSGVKAVEIRLSSCELRKLETKTPEEVLSALYENKQALSQLLQNEDDLAMDDDIMRLLLKRLAQVSQCQAAVCGSGLVEHQSLVTQQSEILNIVRSSAFLKHLGTFLTTMSTAADTAELVNVIGESADLLKMLLILFPSHVHHVVMVQAFMDIALKEVAPEGRDCLPEAVAKKVEAYEVTMEAALEGLHRRQAQHRRGPDSEDHLTPPDDFRSILVFPTVDDLARHNRPFLRKNKQKGTYASVDHYLDVQFRLLREDFISPLRDGIAKYQEMTRAPPRAGERLKDIRVFHNVRIQQAILTPSGVSHRLIFDLTGLQHVRWEVSKRLIHGSLVCLSVDDFRTLYFATVANREPKDLKKGIVDVAFHGREICANPPNTTFVMAESAAFFEAYRHVLAGLQTIHDDDLPFKSYIIHCKKDVPEPKYLTRDTQYDLQPLRDLAPLPREDDSPLAWDFYEDLFPIEPKKAVDEVPVLRRELWPAPALLQLDDTQFEALHCALTREFCLIQGPPGTGKTYVGLKIVKALLHNREAWSPNSDGTMLIVCYTNHALDQFLEGVISFFSGKVVRVGNRLKNEKLEPYSLAHLRQTVRRNHFPLSQRSSVIDMLRRDGHTTMEKLKKEVDTMALQVESARKEIPHEGVLEEYMMRRHYVSLVYKMAKTYAIPEWLGIRGMLNNTGMTSQDLMIVEQELAEGGGHRHIEGDIQALEDRNKLDIDWVSFGRKSSEEERERLIALARERKSYLAVDVSRLDDTRGEQGEGLQLTRDQRKWWKRQLTKKLASNDCMTEQEEAQVTNVWALNMPQRWRLYRSWTRRLCAVLKKKMKEREMDFAELAEQQQKVLLEEDKQIFKAATVIAMTTTAAARYQAVLQEVKPKVIVVEEAAEVLEGHVITTLNRNCQHLILIGDHKQLRPNPTVYELARKYNLELSLFERMIENGLRCNTLGWQHRMRPEIAELVQPIYPNLHNHPSVEEYEFVKGVSSNLFFINHHEPETSDSETKSHSNQYEALYLTQLCLYLLKQGYEPSRITVLTAYSGQLLQLKSLMPRNSEFEGVHVTAVDNFQGEENDIILLSLVRSNPDGRIGFLKTENRVCVALSRAKIGLYVIGNFDQLSANSDLWLTITTSLKTKGLLGEELKLYCQNHPHDDGLVIKNPEDFKNAPEGGCLKPCTFRLNCGHACTKVCHSYDQDHEKFLCMKPCEKKMKCGYEHQCQKLCHMECGKCAQKVQKTLPGCGHMQWMECGMTPRSSSCQEECRTWLFCGHKCGEKCGQPHKCHEKVELPTLCGHTGTALCSEKILEPCSAQCGVLLACGHTCESTCYDCQRGRLHQPCKAKCTKLLVCGHQCENICVNCPPCDKPCENRCAHGSCQKKCGQLCVPCMEPCIWQCPHHQCTRPCSKPCDRTRCNEPCGKILPTCGHACIGLCGEPCPKLCRVCDKEAVKKLCGTEKDVSSGRFVQLEDCGHVVESSSLDKWMTTATDCKKANLELKTCPHCETPIRHHLRYGFLIKIQLRNIETIKNHILGSKEEKKKLLAELQNKVMNTNSVPFKRMKEEVLKASKKTTLTGLVTMKNQMTLLEQMRNIRDACSKASIRKIFLYDAMTKMEDWSRSARQSFSQQEVEDAKMEMSRLRDWVALLSYCRRSVGRRRVTPGLPLDGLDPATKWMKTGVRYTEKQRKSFQELLTKLRKIEPSLEAKICGDQTLTLKVMHVSQGLWLKCPTGHIYRSKTPPNATQESHCPECQ